MNRRAFTLIEITVVVALLAILAAAIMPNLAASRAGQARREFYDALLRSVVDCRERAITSGRTHSLTWDESTREILVAEDPETTTSATSPDPVRRTTAPEGIVPQEFRMGSNTVSSAEWRLRFLPDGRSDGGGIEWSDDGERRSLVITDLGNAYLTDEGLPDPATERWEAGDIEQRT